MVTLDLGCGDYPQGDVNVDIRAGDKVDIVIDEQSYVLPFPDNYFDGVICDNALEHGNDLRMVEEAFRVMKYGSKITVIVPNAYYIRILLRLLKSRRYSVSGDHIHSYGYFELTNLLRRAGFINMTCTFIKKADRFRATVRKRNWLRYGILDEQIKMVAWK